MKRWMAVLALLLLSAVAWGGFRGLGWGTLRQAILEAEGIDCEDMRMDNGDIALRYTRTGFDATGEVLYILRGGRLISGLYIFEGGDVLWYNTLLRALIEHYGPPLAPEMYQAQWMTPEGWILLDVGQGGVFVAVVNPALADEWPQRAVVALW